MTTILVSGTDTGVGKTVVTAGIAAAAMAGGARVGVLKPAESGIAPDAGIESDIEVVRAPWCPDNLSFRMPDAFVVRARPATAVVGPARRPGAAAPGRLARTAVA